MPRRRIRATPAPLLSLVLLAAPAPRADAGALGPPVVLELDELGVEITRQKFIDETTGEITTVNEAVHPDGSSEVIAGDAVLALMRDETDAYRARVGAIRERFAAQLAALAVSDPERRVPVVAEPILDPASLPLGPSFEALVGLTDDESDALARTRRDEIARVIDTATSPLVAALRAAGASNLQTSPLVPMVHAEMRPVDALALARQIGTVGFLYEAGGTPVLDIAGATCATGADAVQAAVNAGGIEVAIVEPDRVQDQTCIDRIGFLGDSDVENHPTVVASVVTSTMSASADLVGVAPGANILSADIDDNAFDVDNISDGVEWAFDNGADVYNLSFATDDSGELEGEDAWLDWFVRHQRRFVAKSAGNTGAGNSCEDTNRVTNPGLGFNVLAVGNSVDDGSCTVIGLSSGSCWVDPSSLHGDRDKPEIAAPGNNINSITFDPSASCLVTGSPSGTSLSSPHVAGIAALLIAREGALQGWPEAIRAILMAGALDDPAPGSSELDGVGGARADVSDAIVTGGRFDTRIVTLADFGGDQELTLTTFSVGNSAQRIKAAIAWDSNPGEEHFYVADELNLSTDFDLYLVREFNGIEVVLGASASFDNSFEWIDVAASPLPTGFYSLRLRVDNVLLGFEYLGVAWTVVDPCAGQGGDSDGDGLCNAADNCAQIANPAQEDFDLDEVGNDCDNCPDDPNPDQSDLDNNGAGDACDPDIDGDGCLNDDDDDPFSQFQRVGTWTSATCPGGNGIQYGLAGMDSDTDGTLDCDEDEVDNDGDGTNDVSDPCPVTDGTNPGLCLRVRECGFTNWFDICLFGGCDEFFAVLADLIDPAPIQRFERLEILNQSLYLAPPTGFSIADAAALFTAGADEGARAPGDPLRLELWRRGAAGAPEQFVALIAQYLPSDVALGDLGPGAWLRLDPTNLLDPEGTGLALRSTWVPATEPGDELPDEDGDTWPNAFDNCRGHANDQRDANGDDFGDVCDPDYDDNGVVGIADFNAMRGAFGSRCLEAGYDGAIDHDGNCAIGISDFSVLRRFFGRPPGPSGIRCLPGGCR